MKIKDFLTAGQVVHVTLDEHAAGAVFAPSGTGPYCQLLDVNEMGVLLAPMVSEMSEGGQWSERPGVPSFVHWEHISALRAHPNATNA
jgi:hypothetical protein